MSKKPEKKEPKTTGHSWDGIEEYDNPMPRWWLWTFYLTIIWGLGYSIAYPAWPGIKGATAGLLGWSTREDVAMALQQAEDANAGINEQLVAAEIAGIPADPQLNEYAVRAGGAVFRTWCAQCHGSGAAGAKGYPNLLDNDWLWGGDMDSIHYTVSHGIRNEDDLDARYSAMPAFGRDELLEDAQIEQVVNYVMSLTGEARDPSQVAEGETVFLDNCASCHGDDGGGDREQGAPALNDAIWLYGGDYNSLTETVHNSRFGVMPPWTGRLSEAEIRAVSAYVHQLGGGEAPVVPAEE